MNKLLKNRRFTTVILGLFLLGGSQFHLFCQDASAKKNDFVSQISQKRIDRYFQEILRFSPRLPGSEIFQKCRSYLAVTLKSFSLNVWEEPFTASTPKGAIEMSNVVAEKKGDTSRIIYLASHIDTKIIDGIEIQGANDSGSSTAALLELAKVISSHKTKYTYRFVFFDGEESLGNNMNESDGLYGSKEHVRRLKVDNLVPSVHVMILLDMIGDKSPAINRDLNSSPELYSLFAACCQRLGYKDLSTGKAASMFDDHVPFLRAGIPSLDLIDFDYGPDNSFWHTEKDTAENVSVISIFKVAQVVANMLEAFEKM
ncbi:MAG: M28 family peptidase [Candidatus Aminicenantes bacterium]|nr:M28 family peptidase [Candidatus Aminicenantes bacterium]